MNTEDTSSDFVIVWEPPKLEPPEFRLYYDDTGAVICYTGDKSIEGNYIVIDKHISNIINYMFFNICLFVIVILTFYNGWSLRLFNRVGVDMCFFKMCNLGGNRVRFVKLMYTW